MKKQQAGFTLIELIAVIIILGILAATAVPKFMDMGNAAAKAAADGIAGSIAGASSMNIANASARAAGVATGIVVPLINNCDDYALLLDGGAVAGYTVLSAAPAADMTTAGETITDCEVTHTLKSQVSAQFTIHYTAAVSP